MSMDTATSVSVPMDPVPVSPVPPGLTIGNLEVDLPVVLAPMAGVTNSAFRTLCRSYGAGLYVSEMITARALVEGNAKTIGMASFGEDETVRSVQLSSVDPTVMGQAVVRLVEHQDVVLVAAARRPAEDLGGPSVVVAPDPEQPLAVRREGQ